MILGVVIMFAYIVEVHGRRLGRIVLETLFILVSLHNMDCMGYYFDIISILYVLWP